MKYANQYVKSAIQLLQAYDGAVPLAVFLKKYFAQHKKFGSKDRKSIAGLCYNYFRLGKAAQQLSIEDAIKIAVFLCNDAPGIWAALFDEHWLANWKSDLSERISFVVENYSTFYQNKVFPFEHQLSAEIAATPFAQSHFIQPNLFLRLRPGKQKKVIAALTNANIPFNELSEGAIELPNSSKLEEIIIFDQDAVVQDWSSQKVGALLKQIDANKTLSVWDCCAASGGKSIMAKDVLENINLIVSDIRSSILHNLSQRFERAAIKQYKKLVIDLSNDHLLKDKMALPLPMADLVIADVPCTGSGTWSRTPEQLFYFREEQIEVFQALQQKIISNILPSVKAGGYLLFITCSVFKKENEANTVFIQEKSSLQLLTQGVIKGYTNKADTMFAALFQAK
jgi:16S rRNA (cytosine967-C5)-methyltransferase